MHDGASSDILCVIFNTCFCCHLCHTAVIIFAIMLCVYINATNVSRVRNYVPLSIVKIPPCAYLARRVYCVVYLRKRINVIGRCKLIIPITYYSCDKKRRFKWYATPAPSMNLCFSDYSLSHGKCEIFSDIFFSHLLSHIFLSHFSRIFVLTFSFSHFFVWEIFEIKNC